MKQKSSGTGIYLLLKVLPGSTKVSHLYYLISTDTVATSTHTKKNSLTIHPTQKTLKLHPSKNPQIPNNQNHSSTPLPKSTNHTLFASSAHEALRHHLGHGTVMKYIHYSNFFFPEAQDLVMYFISTDTTATNTNTLYLPPSILQNQRETHNNPQKSQNSRAPKTPTHPPPSQNPQTAPS